MAFISFKFGRGVIKKEKDFSLIEFPMIRRVFSRLLGNDIVAVQSMSTPTGRLFYFDPRKTKKQSNFKFGRNNKLTFHQDIHRLFLYYEERA